MELKFGWYPIPLISIRGSNRTFMELKLATAFPLSKF